MRAALQRRTTALAVDIAVGDDRIGGVVNLQTLPVHADRGAVAVARAAGRPVLERERPCQYPYLRMGWRYKDIMNLRGDLRGSIVGRRGAPGRGIMVAISVRV